MRFENRVIHDDDALREVPEDESGELVLPAELDELAGRLTAESRELDRLFPAARVSDDAGPAASPRKMLPAVSGAIALVAVVSCAVWVLLTPAARQPVDTPPASDPVAIHEPTEGARPTAGELEAGAASIPAIMVLHDVSGAELEGVLDILESETAEQHDVSI